MEREKPNIGVLETKPKMFKWNQHFWTATKPRKKTNAKPKVPNPQSKKGKSEYCQTQSRNKFIIKSGNIYNLLPLWWLLSSKNNNRMSKNLKYKCDIKTGKTKTKNKAKHCQLNSNSGAWKFLFFILTALTQIMGLFPFPDIPTEPWIAPGAPSPPGWTDSQGP
jgi:hypothetical protein